MSSITIVVYVLNCRNLREPLKQVEHGVPFRIEPKLIEECRALMKSKTRRCHDEITTLPQFLGYSGSVLGRCHQAHEFAETELAAPPKLRLLFTAADGCTTPFFN